MTYNYLDLQTAFPKTYSTLNNLILTRNPAIYNQACEILQIAYNYGIKEEPTLITDFYDQEVDRLFLCWSTKEFNFVIRKGSVYIFGFNETLCRKVEFTCIYKALDWFTDASPNNSK